MARAMRAYLMKKGDDDINSFEDGQFKVGDRVLNRAHTSLCCKITNKSKIRQKAMQMIENPWFDKFILFCIAVNSVCMALFDYTENNKCAYE